MASELVSVVRDGHVATVTFLRPAEAVGEEVEVEGAAEPEVITESKAEEEGAEA